MKSKDLQYEMKFSDRDDWIEVSETVFLHRLSDIFYPITPVILKMLKGSEIPANSVMFRIKIRKGAKGILIPDKIPITPSALN